MSALQQSVFEALTGFAGLSALIGKKVFLDQADQGTAQPYVVWQEISMVPETDLDGSHATGGLENSRIQIGSYAAKASDACAIDLQVRLAMEAATFTALVVDRRRIPFEADTKLFGAQTDFSMRLAT